MRKLNMFQKFDFGTWQAGKKFMVVGVKFNEKKNLVTLEVIIIEDKTNYGDPGITNLYEKFYVHCIKDVNPEDINKYPVQSNIIFKSIGKCSVWGDFSSNLSVEAVVEVAK